VEDGDRAVEDVVVSASPTPATGLPVARVDPHFWRERRVLVTGHTGFKGAWLTLWLTELGAQVTGVSNAVPTEPSLFELCRLGGSVTDLRADIRDLEALADAVAVARPEVVVHMAAQSLVRPSFDDPRQTYETNVMGTVNVFEAVRRFGGVRAMVNVTSDKCYENREWERGYREDDPMGGHDPYSSSKGCAELITTAFRRSFFAADGLRLASARAGNVIGGGDWAADRLVPDMMRGALSGQPIRIRNPNSTRPWQHVLSPLTGYLVLAQRLWESDRFATGWNFGPDDADARTVGWIVERLSELWPERFAWVIDSGPHPHEARYLKLDSSRAREQLGWRPWIGLELALESIVDWYRKLESGADMRAVTVAQIDRLACAERHV
jgi:CDP-glucose 4,6-dehydratase